MTVYVLEYLGMAWLRAGASGFPAPESPAMQVTVISSAGSSDAGKSTIAFTAKTELVEIVATNQNFFFQVGSSAFSTVASTISSTNSEVALFNTRTVRGVPSLGKLIGWSS